MKFSRHGILPNREVNCFLIRRRLTNSTSSGKTISIGSMNIRTIPEVIKRCGDRRSIV